jgi:methyltransferase
MTALYWIVLAVAVQRLGEAVLARRNMRRLLAAGGFETGAGHHAVFFVVHGAWLLSVAMLVPSDGPVHWPLLALYAALQGVRYWVIRSLGMHWTTRIITVPGRPLVRSGPYRYFRHPNYAVVAGEIALLPLVFGAWQIALVFSVLNGALLAHRIRIENAALAKVAQ